MPLDDLTMSSPEPGKKQRSASKNSKKKFKDEIVINPVLGDKEDKLMGESNVLNSLFKKSINHNIPLSAITEVYQRGLVEYCLLKPENKTAQQYAFDRVNSFINNGAAARIDSDIAENLRDWFKDKWVRMDTQGNIKGPCAREEGEGKPKCLPSDKAHSMDKKDRASAAIRKRREDPNPERTGSAINVRTEEKDACYNKVKSRYNIWPSAYASGALSKCRKVGAKNWGNKTEEYQSNENFINTSMGTVTNMDINQKFKELFEGSGPKEKQKTPYRDINSPEYKKAVEKHKNAMDSEQKASKGKELLKRLMKKEEFEQVDEISSATKMRYVAKAAASTHEPKEGESQSEYLGRMSKRMSGIKTALKKTNPSERFQKESVQIPDKTVRHLRKITKQLDKSVRTHHKQSQALKKLVDADMPDVKENKNCGCGQTPCKTYGK